jgi:hypothetical protein
MKWRSNDYRGTNQGLEVDSKVWERVKLWELTGKGQAFKTDKQKTNKAKQKQKGLFPLTPKPVNLKYTSISSFVFGISGTTIVHRKV